MVTARDSVYSEIPFTAREKGSGEQYIKQTQTVKFVPH